MNKLLLFFEIILSITVICPAYCAKMPEGGIKEIQNTKTNNKTQNNKKNQTQTKKQSNQIKLSKEIIEGIAIGTTGIGATELSSGLSEQKSNKEAEYNLNAYKETMYCTYGDSKQIKAGPNEIELPGKKNEEIKKLRAEYMALAASLKERKELLGLEPGIESEIILDKQDADIYNNENTGIENGVYESFYRAQIQNNKIDQEKIDKSKDETQNRITGGAVSVGLGVVSGIITNKTTPITQKIKTQNTKQQTKQKEKK